MQASLKTVPKRNAAEKVGVIGKRNGKYDMVEYSEFPESMAAETLPDGTLKFNQGNILVFVVQSEFLLKLACGTGDDGSDPTDLYHRAHKKISYYDHATGEQITPTDVNGWKFELFLQEFLPKVDLGRLGVLSVDRETEFAPVKNADAPIGQPLLPDTPAWARKMILDEAAKWLEPCEAEGLKINPATKGNIEVSFMLSYQGEHLG